MNNDPRLTTIGPALWQLATGHNINATICAGNNVTIDTASLDELATLATLAKHCRTIGATLTHLAATPDLHKGAGVPIGTIAISEGAVIPRIVGNDVGCGMRLSTLHHENGQPVHTHEINRTQFANAARRRFFDGDRRVALTPHQRHTIAHHGLKGLLNTADHGQIANREGIWAHLNTQHPERTHNISRTITQLPPGYDDWIRGAARHNNDTTYDTTLGNIGGGNHFCELQHTTATPNPTAAHHHGLTNGTVAVMAHTGSLWTGYRAHELGHIDATRNWPTGTPKPADDLYPLALDQADRCMDAMTAAGNIAEANRLICTLLTAGAISDTLDETITARLVWDAPHNYAWQNGNTITHRKGATPAGAATENPTHWWGEPVIIPGSMGTTSWLAAGTGSPATHSSACHGAGRALRRGTKVNEHDLDRFLDNFTIITPHHGHTRRPDIEREWRRTIAQEAPWMYKDIGPVITALETANIAHRIAELTPLATVKQV